MRPLRVNGTFLMSDPPPVQGGMRFAMIDQRFAPGNVVLGVVVQALPKIAFTRGWPGAYEPASDDIT
jgi:hypothetical protein